MSNPLEDNRNNENKFRMCSNMIDYESKYNIVTNSDNRIISNYKWCFSKGFTHKNNIPKKQEIIKLIKGIKLNYKYLDNIKLGGNLKLVDPSCVWSFDICGSYKSTMDVSPPPGYSSAEMAGEMVELYNMALLRDVSFTEYQNDYDVELAIQDLNKLKKFTGSKPVTVQNLFRGTTEGDLIGPYVSQFLFLPYKYGVVSVNQKTSYYEPNKDFCTNVDNLIQLQNGSVVESGLTRVGNRYMQTLRDGITWVHLDDPVQVGIQTVWLLQTMKCPRSVTIKGSGREESFVDCQTLDIIDLLTKASRVGMLAAWYNKWNYLRIRPEAYGLDIHQTKFNNAKLPIHSDILNSDVLNRIYDKYQSYLLPQGYSEGCPIHPAYPAGHATFAGAMITIIKAFFDESFEIYAFVPNVDGTELVSTNQKVTVGHELDKLASNIALFRDAAGVHYRSDGIGIKLGEQIAISLLQKHVKRYARPTKLTLHDRSGKKIVIKN